MSSVYATHRVRAEESYGFYFGSVALTIVAINQMMGGGLGDEEEDKILYICFM